MLTRIDLRDFDGDVADRLPRPEVRTDGPVAVVREILQGVRDRGDSAIREFTEQFDGVKLDSAAVESSDIAAALDRIDPLVRTALEVAAQRIAVYHQAQMPDDVDVAGAGVVIAGRHHPVRRAGCYVPGGRAAYPSTVLMTAIVARVAGVEEVVVCVPPDSDGSVPDVTLAAAAVAGVDEVFAIGGAQAIGALAYGTETIRAVDVIVGPGNTYVAVAKQEVAGVVGVPSSFAGPSEVVVVADGSAPSEFAAIDLIVQAEHGPDGLAWLVTWDENFADEVTAAVERLASQAPRRSDIESTLASSGYAVLCSGPAQAMAVSNHIAPEHLELQTADPQALLGLVRDAGAVFCGAWTPASLGDYVAGPSHVLPTSGTARFASSLTVRDFMKDIHIVTADAEGFAMLGDHVLALAGAEGLDAHAASIRIRQEALT